MRWLCDAEVLPLKSEADLFLYIWAEGDEGQGSDALRTARGQKWCSQVTCRPKPSIWPVLTLNLTRHMLHMHICGAQAYGRPATSTAYRIASIGDLPHPFRAKHRWRKSTGRTVLHEDLCRATSFFESNGTIGCKVELLLNLNNYVNRHSLPVSLMLTRLPNAALIAAAQPKTLSTAVTTCCAARAASSGGTVLLSNPAAATAACTRTAPHDSTDENEIREQEWMSLKSASQREVAR